MQEDKKQVVCIIPPGVHLLDITGPAQIFFEAQCNGAPVRLYFCSIFPEKTESESSCSLYFNRLTPYDQLELRKGDLVILPGMDYKLLSNGEFLASTLEFQGWLKTQHNKEVVLCSVCIGAFLLAEAGLLNERDCTTHWEFTDRLKQRYPRVRMQTNRLFVEQGEIYTSAGIASGIDLSLYLVEKFWGGHFAAKIAKEAVIYFRRTPDDPQLNVFTQYRNHIDNRIHEVQDLLSQSLDKKFSIEDLSEKANMSPRNLTRLFKKTTQVTIGVYLGRLRAAHAQKLIAEGHTLQAAALHCGLKSVNQLRFLLKQYGVQADETGGSGQVT